MTAELLSSTPTVQRMALYESLLERYPEPPIAEFGEICTHHEDHYDRMELAQHLLDLQGMTDFLSVDTTPIGNGIGFVVVSFTGGKEKFRKAIFESSDDARHFIAEIRDASLRNERHWFMNPHPYMASHRSLKSLSKKESSHD